MCANLVFWINSLILKARDLFGKALKKICDKKVMLRGKAEKMQGKCLLGRKIRKKISV